MQQVPLVEEKPNWFYRRVIIFGTLIFSAFALTYLITKATSDPLREELALAITSLDAAIITGYVFGAVWDDANFMKTRAQNMMPGMPGVMGGGMGMGMGMGGMMPGMGGMGQMMPGLGNAMGQVLPGLGPAPATPAPGLPSPSGTTNMGIAPAQGGLMGGLLSSMKKPRNPVRADLGPIDPNEGKM